MESLPFRTGSGSIPVQTPSSPPVRRSSFSFQDPTAAAERSGASFPRILSQMSRRSIRRTSSEPDLIHTSARRSSIGGATLGSRSFTVPRVIEDEDEDAAAAAAGGTNNNNNHRQQGNRSGGGGGGGDDRRSLGEYYRKMVRADPTNCLLLRNYGQYLEEVEKDAAMAAEFYERAILSGPPDGDLLCLYAKLTWQTLRDRTRASFYFNQALQASPNDRMGVVVNFTVQYWDRMHISCGKLKKMTKKKRKKML
ncbi:uncharacterized protein LOC127243622 isoform X2 [Andrographis paniculata]|uniref:uncharacterized protein LOC127243622 isoform X2 n=1 Tax=Andrographis paniculata TaxID=175694 RepID=UPI0021E9772D|nr:uncharacterized protein LOC127243622 isoform X2 [Andrographis paniculata]